MAISGTDVRTDPAISDSPTFPEIAGNTAHIFTITTFYFSSHMNILDNTVIETSKQSLIVVVGTRDMDADGMPLA